MIRRFSRRSVLLIGGIVLVFIAGSAGMILEENDRFCGTCHLGAERTYYNRAQLAMDYPSQPIPDLATFHYVDALNDPQLPEFRCVDCHRGNQGILHRLTTLGVGIYDSVAYLAGDGSATEIEKRKLEKTSGLVEAACLKCHTDELVTLGFNNHYHAYLPAAETAYEETGDLSVEAGTDFEEERRLLLEGIQVKATDTTCLDCHLGHVTVIGGESVQFIEIEARDQGCTRCHVDNDLQIDLLQ